MLLAACHSSSVASSPAPVMPSVSSAVANLSVSGDLRFHRESQKDSERMRMRAIVAQHLQRGDAEITSKSGGAGDLSFVEPFAARAPIFIHRLITDTR